MKAVVKILIAVATITGAAAPAVAESLIVVTPPAEARVGAGPYYYRPGDANDPYWRHRRYGYYQGAGWGHHNSYAYAPAAAPGFYVSSPRAEVVVDRRYRISARYHWGHRHYGYWQADPHWAAYDISYASASCRTIVVQRGDGPIRRVRRCY